ncbi:hypothetical protein F444_19908 [Phytophthora nicotianae P1976]|nr:hypothetical protein F444_19908 [Phytophthora nicotianae P1976]
MTHNVDVTKDDSSGEGDGIAQVRLARMKARKAAKREKTKQARESRRRTERDVHDDQRGVDGERRAARRREREEAMEQLEVRRVVRSDEERVQVGGEPARVSLVQHRDAEWKGVDNFKLDSGARYTVAGTDWMQFGDRVETTAPVDYVEGIGGFLLDVVGVWHFNMYNVFGEVISVDACIVKGCNDEFLFGVDFMRTHGATMDFHNNEIRYSDGGLRVVIPFKTFDKAGGAKIAVVRMARTTRLDGTAVTPVEVAITADDREQGLFVPTQHVGPLMLAATVTRAKNGKAWVLAINSSDEQTRLPVK